MASRPQEEEQRDGSLRPSRLPSSSNMKSRAYVGPRTTSSSLLQWKDLPEFCDATAAVSCATFGSRRLPEIRALYHRTTPFGGGGGRNGGVAEDDDHKEDAEEDDDRQERIASRSIGRIEDALRGRGCRTSNRHLRRRVASHQGRKRHRFPRGPPASVEGEKESVAATASFAPSTEKRELDGEVDPAELRSREGVKGGASATLAATLSTTTKTRRNPGVPEETPLLLSRRKRRRKRASLCWDHEAWMRGEEEELDLVRIDAMAAISDGVTTTTTTTTASNRSKTENSGCGPDRRKVRWIPSHLWHAKRFSMRTMWGWSVPVVHAGRGGRAALRLAREGRALVQDATYSDRPLVELEFSEETARHQDLLAAELNRIIPGFRLDPDGERRVRGGILHHPDAFPLRAIGPVEWIVLTHRLFRSELNHIWPSSPSETDAPPASVQTRGRLYLLLFVHVSIREEAVDCLLQWLASSRMTGALLSASSSSSLSSPPPPSSSNAPSGFFGAPFCFAVLRLRGASAAASLQQAASALGWDRIPIQVLASDSLILPANHGRLVSFPTTCSRPSDASARPDDNGRRSIGNRYDASEVGCLVVHGIIRCSRDPSAAGNLGVVGLDLWCPPAVAPELMAALVVRGGACPVGLVEQTLLAMEAAPPVPVFPRDFVDTAAGAAYWTGATADWILYRSCLEGGSGRVSPSVHRLPDGSAVDWSSLIAGAIGDTTALVRGSFGQLFKRCFPSFDEDEPREDSQRGPSLRRPRRPSRAPSVLVWMPPLPSERLVQHQSLCRSLLESLSLPALLLCHVVVSGEGTMMPGDTIFADERYRNRVSRRPLGRVTFGAFSHARGSVHGLAVCGAGRILETMIADRSFVRTESYPRSCRETRLAVFVGNTTPKYSGSLSFLF